MPPAIAEALGLREAGDWPLVERLKSHLQERQLLLLLDNFEQILPAASTLSTLLAACPDLNLLVTSRAVLHVRGEQEFSVAPLALPQRLSPSESGLLENYPATALFIGVWGVTEQKVGSCSPPSGSTRQALPTPLFITSKEGR